MTIDIAPWAARTSARSSVVVPTARVRSGSSREPSGPAGQGTTSRGAAGPVRTPASVAASSPAARVSPAQPTSPVGRWRRDAATTQMNGPPASSTRRRTAATSPSVGTSSTTTASSGALGATAPPAAGRRRRAGSHCGPVPWASGRRGRMPPPGSTCASGVRSVSVRTAAPSDGTPGSGGRAGSVAARASSRTSSVSSSRATCGRSASSASSAGSGGALTPGSRGPAPGPRCGAGREARLPRAACRSPWPGGTGGRA